jgi:hypothetical protein
MSLVSGARYDALQTRYQQVTEARDEAVELAAERQATITRQAAELTALRDQSPASPLPQPRPMQGDVEVRRQLYLARQAMAALDEQCRTLQHVNEVQARQLRELAEKAREVTAP